MNTSRLKVFLILLLLTACTKSTSSPPAAEAKSGGEPATNSPDGKTDPGNTPKNPGQDQQPEQIYSMTEIILGGKFIHSERELTYDKAVAYCEGKGLRLPTTREFLALATRFFGAETRETHDPDATFSVQYGYWDNLEVQNMHKQGFEPIYKQRADGSIVLDFYLKTKTYMQLENIDSSFQHGEYLLTSSAFKIPWGTYKNVSHALGWYGDSSEDWVYKINTNTMPNISITQGFDRDLARGSFICIPKKVAPEATLPTKCLYSDMSVKPAYDFAVLKGYKSCSVKKSVEVADPRENVAALLVRLDCDGGAISVKSYFMKRDGDGNRCDPLSSELAEK